MRFTKRQVDANRNERVNIPKFSKLYAPV